MSPRLYFALAVVAVVLGAAVAWFMNDRRGAPDVPGRGSTTAALGVADAGRALFARSGCTTCHGSDARGGGLGPSLHGVGEWYLEAADGDRARARDRLVAYLENPQGVATLREDDKTYPNPMLSARVLGIKEPANLAAVAEWILQLRAAR